MNDYMNIDNYLKTIEQNRVISSSAGGAVGSILKLELINNCYFMINCSWRLEQNEIVISTSTDSIFPDNGLTTKSVLLLKEKVVRSIYRSKQNDLTIFFEDNFCLKIFCDISYTNEDFDINWELNFPDEDVSFEAKNNFGIKMVNYW